MYSSLEKTIFKQKYFAYVGNKVCESLEANLKRSV